MKKYAIKNLNLSASFILPLVDIPNKALITNYRLYNTYLYDLALPNYRSGHIFVVHKNYQDLKFEEFEQVLVGNKNFIDSYDIAKSRYGVKVYEIPKEHQDCLVKLLAGGYSRIKEETKKIITGNNVTDHKFIHKVLYKDKKLREKVEARLSNPKSVANLVNQEIWSKIDFVKEELSPKVKAKLLKSKLSPSKEFK
jgi:hypothetical protein